MSEKKRTYEVSHICAAVVATAGIVGAVVVIYAQQSNFDGKDSLTDWLMFFVSFGGLIVSVAAFVYLRGTFEATKDQAKISQLTYDKTIEAYRYNNRPRLTVLRDPDADYYFSSKGEVKILKFNVRNTGKSNARAVGVRSSTVLTEISVVKQQFVEFLKNSQIFPGQNNVFSDIVQDEDAGIVIEIERPIVLTPNPEKSEIFTFVALQYRYDYALNGEFHMFKIGYCFRCDKKYLDEANGIKSAIKAITFERDDISM